jgi:hypothetical protein
MNTENWGNVVMPGAGKMINSFLHPEDAYKAAQDESNKAWGEAQGYEKPFYQQGLDQYGGLNSAENNLMNPSQLQDQWADSYKTSDYAKQMLNQNQASGLDAASSMGLMGSSAAVNNIQQGAHNVVNQDRQQYMNDLMQKYMAGIGIGQNIYGIGANMGATLGNQSMQHGQDMAGLKYGEQSAPGALFGKLAGTVANGAANYATGGMWGGAKSAGGYTG